MRKAREFEEQEDEEIYGEYRVEPCTGDAGMEAEEGF